MTKNRRHRRRFSKINDFEASEEMLALASYAGFGHLHEVDDYRLD